MSSEYPSPAKSRDQSPWRVFKGRGPWAEAAQAAGFRARPRVSRAAATLPFRDGLPFPAGVHSIYACIASMHKFNIFNAQGLLNVWTIQAPRFKA